MLYRLTGQTLTPSNYPLPVVKAKHTTLSHIRLLVYPIPIFASSSQQLDALLFFLSSYNISLAVYTISFLGPALARFHRQALTIAENVKRMHRAMLKPQIAFIR